MNPPTPWVAQLPIVHRPMELLPHSALAQSIFGPRPVGLKGAPQRTALPERAHPAAPSAAFCSVLSF